MRSDETPRFRPFDAERDAAHLLRGQVLVADEQVRWSSLEGIRYYLVDGLEANGDIARVRSGWITGLMLALKIVFFPITIFFWLWLSDSGGSGGANENVPGASGNRRSPPDSIVFGSGPDCMAVIDPRGPTPGRGAGIWLFTDRRFARFSFEYGLPEGTRDPYLDRNLGSTSPVEPISLRTDFEIDAEKIRFEPLRECRLPARFKPRTAVYHRFVLPDGSGFEIMPEEQKPRSTS
jgi:hypothetical protein